MWSQGLKFTLICVILWNWFPPSPLVIIQNNKKIWILLRILFKIANNLVFRLQQQHSTLFLQIWTCDALQLLLKPAILLPWHLVSDWLSYPSESVHSPSDCWILTLKHLCTEMCLCRTCTQNSPRLVCCDSSAPIITADARYGDKVESF